MISTYSNISHLTHYKISSPDSNISHQMHVFRSTSWFSYLFQPWYCLGCPNFYVFTNIFCCHICIVLRLGLSLHSFIAVFRYFRPWRCSSFRWVLYIVLHLQGFHHQRGCFRVKGERYSGEKKICLPEMSTASVFADDFNHPGGRTETAPLCGRVDSNSDCNGAQLVDSVFEAAH